MEKQKMLTQKPQDIKERTFEFAISIIQFAELALVKCGFETIGSICDIYWCQR